MYKKIMLLVSALALILTLVSCTSEQSKFQVYSFSGENGEMAINNGIIVVSDKLEEKFVGGNLSFKVDIPSDVKDYKSTFYFNNSNGKEALLNNTFISKGTETGQEIQSDLGTTNGKNLFNDDKNVEFITKTLSFSLTGTYMNGEKFEKNLTLDVQKVY